MFRVDADSLKEYFVFDPEREIELQKLDRLIRSSASGLKRYFHRGTPAGEPGMRFKMIGYANFTIKPRDRKYSSNGRRWSGAPKELHQRLPFSIEERSSVARVLSRNAG